MWSNEAEVWAIVNALEVATNLIQRTRGSNAMVTPRRVVVIYSDNISALFRVKACPIGRSAPIWEMVEKTCTYTAAIEQYGFGVELRWIPGHVDALEGHNEADRAAGRARRNQNTYILSFDYVESLDEEGNAMDPFAK
jgi:ribonuclease HI